MSTSNDNLRYYKGICPVYITLHGGRKCTVEALAPVLLKGPSGDAIKEKGHKFTCPTRMLWRRSRRS